MIIINRISSGKSSNSSKGSSNSRSSNCSSAVAAVVEEILTSRNCNSSSSSSCSSRRKCSSSSSSICIFSLSLLKIVIVMAVIIHLRVLANVPKLRVTKVMQHRLKRYNVLCSTSGLRSGWYERIKGNWVNRLISHSDRQLYYLNK